MTTTIVITSGKGGVGKTNISVNTAIELARHDYRVCLLDADLGLANVNILLGLYPDKNLDDVISQTVSLEDIIVQTDHGIDIIPGSSGVEEMANLGGEKLSRLVDGFTALTEYDYLLIDTSSGISRGVISFCLAATETLLVLTAEATSLTDAYGLLKVLSQNDYRGTVKILVNKCATVPQAKKTFTHFKSVVDKRLNVNIVPGGVILKDPTVEKAVSSQQPAHVLYPQNTFSLCIKALVSNLTRKALAVKSNENCGDFWSRYIDYLQADLVLPGAAKKVTPLKGKRLDEPGSATSHDKKKPVAADVVAPPTTTDYPAPHPAPQSIAYKEELVTAYFKTPPALLASVLEMQSSGQLSVEKMREFIVCDPGLTMRVLHTYCLSVSQRPRGVINLTEVLEELDEQKISRLLLSTATKDLLSSTAPEQCFALNSWWKHSLKCAMMVKALAELLGDPLLEAGYLAGLLHDIGRWGVTGQHLDDGKMFVSPEKREETGRGERNEDGADQSEIGANLLAEVNICSLIVDAVRYHDEAEARVTTAFSMTKLVYIAHLLIIPHENTLIRGVRMAAEHFDLSASQVYTCIQVVSEKCCEVAKKYGVSCSGDIDHGTMVNNLHLYRQQAIDYVTLQTVLQLPAHPEMSDMVCAMHQGLSQIFGINRIVCLFADKKQTFLNAAGYSGCFCEENIQNIQFSLHSGRSLVVAAYRSDTSTILSCKSLQSLADRQVMDLLESDVLLCLPLTHPGAVTKQGLILCGVPQSRRASYTSLQEKLEKFALQVAMKIDTCF